MNRDEALKRIYAAGRYWNSKYLERELKKVSYLTPQEKRTAIRSCDDYTVRFGWDSQISELQDIPTFMIIGLIGTFFGLLWIGDGLASGQNIADSSFPLKKALALTATPIWVGLYGLGAIKWDQKINGVWGSRRDLINKLPDYKIQD